MPSRGNGYSSTMMHFTSPQVPATAFSTPHELTLACLDTPYLAMQIRANDKKSEMDPHQWDFMNNMTRVALAVAPYLETSHITWIYISTDTCDYIPGLRQLLGTSGRTIVSPCDHPVVEGQPGRGHPEDTLRLLAEIEMMRGGAWFFGLMRSNLCSTVWLLRHGKAQRQTVNFISCVGCQERLELYSPGGNGLVAASAAI